MIALDGLKQQSALEMQRGHATGIRPRLGIESIFIPCPVCLSEIHEQNEAASDMCRHGLAGRLDGPRFRPHSLLPSQAYLLLPDARGLYTVSSLNIRVVRHLSHVTFIQ